MQFEAHRGVGSDYPENTMPAFWAAYRLGFSMIEFDPKVTKDGVPVVLHDKTIGRTARNFDKTPAPDLKIADLTYAEAMQYDFGLHKGDAFSGTHLPTLAEFLAFAREVGIPVKTDNCIDRFSAGEREAVLAVCERARLGSLLGLTSNDPEILFSHAVRFPEATLHYDGPLEEDALSRLSSAAEGRLYIWLRLDCKLTAWSKLPPADAETVALARRYGKVGLWLAESEEDRATALALAPDILESTGSLRP